MNTEDVMWQELEELWKKYNRALGFEGYEKTLDEMNFVKFALADLYEEQERHEESRRIRAWELPWKTPSGGEFAGGDYHSVVAGFTVVSERFHDGYANTTPYIGLFAEDGFVVINFIGRGKVRYHPNNLGFIRRMVGDDRLNNALERWRANGSV